MAKTKGNRTLTTDVDWDQLALEYEAGSSQTALAKKYNLSQGTVGYQLGKRLTLRTPTNSHKANIIDWDWVLSQNKIRSCSSIATELGVTVPTIARGIREREVNLSYHPYRPKIRYEVDPTLFDALSPEVAYWLGMLITDGCIHFPTDNSTPYFSLELQDRDKIHLDKFRSFLGVNCSITITRKDDRNYYRVRIRSVELVNKLAYYGVTSNKTHTASAHPSLWYSRDFWRGCVDGDGSINKARKEVYLCGVALPLLHQFQNYVTFSGYTYRDYTDSDNVSRVYAKGEGFILHLYTDATVYLDRKYNRALGLRLDYDENE